MDKSDVFRVSSYADIDIYNKVLRFNRPCDTFILPNDSTIINWRFLTLTFDPLKFGIDTSEVDRKRYILYKLMRAIKHDIVSDFYGCFEYHESGIIHAHVLIKTEYSDSFIEDYFQPEFTDNRRNKRAVKCLPAKTTVINYIHKTDTPDKRSNDFFKLKKNISPLDPASNKKIISKKSESDSEGISEIEFSNKKPKGKYSTSYGPSDTYREMFGQK